MNISLKGTGKKKGALGFGLNSRSTATKKAKKPAAVSSNVFGDEDDESDGDDGITSSRDRVNQQIAKEQAALRERAQAALAMSSKTLDGDKSNIYDYDGAYDSFAVAPDQKKKIAAKEEQERKSKYIGEMLEQSKKRQREREIVTERKIAREQALEDAQEDFAGKEKFVTKAYRRKLEERQAWQAEQDVKEREEQAKDVTKQTGAGAAMATFYGNFGNNISMGGGKSENDAAIKDSEDKPANNPLDDDNNFLPGKGGGFLAGFESSKPASDAGENDSSIDNAKMTSLASREGHRDVSEQAKKEPILTPRQRREQKVAEARIRYMTRKAAARGGGSNVTMQ